MGSRLGGFPRGLVLGRRGHRYTLMYGSGKENEKLSCVFWINPRSSFSVTFAPCSPTAQGPGEGQEGIYMPMVGTHAS